MIQYGYQRLISAQVEVSASDCQKLFFPCKADRGTGRLSKDDVMKQKRSPARDASLRRSRITHRGKERYAELCLKYLDGMGQGRLGNVKGFCCARQVLQLGCLLEIAQGKQC